MPATSMPSPSSLALRIFLIFLLRFMANYRQFPVYSLQISDGKGIELKKLTHKYRCHFVKNK